MAQNVFIQNHYKCRVSSTRKYIWSKDVTNPKKAKKRW